METSSQSKQSAFCTFMPDGEVKTKAFLTRAAQLNERANGMLFPQAPLKQLFREKCSAGSGNSLIKSSFERRQQELDEPREKPKSSTAESQTWR